MANKIIHKHSSVITDNKAKLPSAEQLDYGELAINYANGVETISIKNSADKIIEFKTAEYFEKLFINNNEITSETLNNLDIRVTELENSDNSEIIESLNNKQDVISDLETIRSGASKGATALQTIPSEYVTESELNAKNYATTSQVNAKQDVISDLETIRSGASKGATALQSIPSEYITETELNAKGYTTTSYVDNKVAALVNGAPETLDTLDELALALKDNKDIVDVLNNSIATKQDVISDLETIRSGASKGATALQSYTEQYKGTIEAVSTTESIDGVSNDFVTSEQLDARDYATTTNVNQQISTLENKNNSLSNRIATLENNSIIDARASVLWLGTSIASGDISIDPQQNNTYPKMVADALGFELYNMAKAGSVVSWYPATPSWTTSAQVAAEFATAYCLSATRQEIYDKYYTVLETIRRNEGLSTTWRDDYLNDFMDSSYETRIIPYIDGTIAKCDGVVIDHGFNDRGNIFNVCNQHITADKDSISVWGPGSGADGVEYPVIGGNAGWYWLTHLADGRYYDGEVYMNTVYAVANGLAGNDTGGMRGEYFGAMAYIIAKIQQVDPRIRIVIGNYFSQDYGSALGDGMNSFQTKYILQANQSIADYYGFPCVNVYKHTGLRNRTIRKPDGTYISDMYWFCPDGVHPSSDTTGLSNSIIASAYVSQIKGCFFKLD